MENCVFCAFLLPGTDATNRGRHSDQSEVKRQNWVGMEHPIEADVSCRNTLSNGLPQTDAEYSQALGSGTRHLLIECLDDAPDRVPQTLTLYADAIAGRRNTRWLCNDLKATTQYRSHRGRMCRALIDFLSRRANWPANRSFSDASQKVSYNGVVAVSRSGRASQ
jgi:U32 family peptidase